ncbi:MAG: type VI secretion system baseplate subunit TssE [Gemmatimonas sp.]|nr:type VI secretion system baseplate subunit TssE [Gemmatimonas sp.]
MSARQERTVRLSVLDRLIDRHPGLGDGRVTWDDTVDALKQSLLEDLDWLLNSRRIAEPAPERYPEIRSSVYHFGLPDVTSKSADSPQVQADLAREIEECIRLFEPRLTAVRVSVRPGGEAGSRLTRFVIEGLLRLDPDPERVLFDTVLETSTGRFHISGDGDA